ncbi:hypothetical protein SAMN05216565_1295 [Litchfieldia salsa]|uniref:Uncharacterized protein n=1 Tax=Litchfieldia salsa TaxID=930152 RepID=A0A1H0X3A8_9BACI|nr:hypothetical protein SAMN05216565_1295 [Litchfieldia salsa]
MKIELLIPEVLPEQLDDFLALLLSLMSEV